MRSDETISSMREAVASAERARMFAGTPEVRASWEEELQVRRAALAACEIEVSTVAAPTREGMVEVHIRDAYALAEAWYEGSAGRAMMPPFRELAARIRNEKVDHGVRALAVLYRERAKGTPHQWRHDAREGWWCTRCGSTERRDTHDCLAARVPAPAAVSEGQRMRPVSLRSDMGPQVLTAIIEDDGDVDLRLFDEQCGGISWQACVPGTGGGRYPHTLRALRALVHAMHLDDAAHHSGGHADAR